MPGLHGIMLPGVETADEVAAAAELLTVMERQRGLVVGSLQLITLLESALGVWNIRSIITASPRVRRWGWTKVTWHVTWASIPCRSTIPMSTRVAVSPLKPLLPKCSLLVCSILERNPRLLAAAEIHTMANDARNLGMKR